MPKNDQAISSGVQTKQHPGKRLGSLSAGSAILSIGAAVLTNLLLSGRGAPWDFAFECASLAGDAFAALLKAAAPFVVFLSVAAGFLQHQNDAGASPQKNRSLHERRVLLRAGALYAASMTGAALMAYGASIFWWRIFRTPPTSLQSAAPEVETTEELPHFPAILTSLESGVRMIQDFSDLFTGERIFGLLLAGLAAGALLSRTSCRANSAAAVFSRTLLRLNALCVSFLKKLLAWLPIGLFGLLTGIFQRSGPAEILRCGELGLLMAGETLLIGFLLMPLLYAAGRSFKASLHEIFSTFAIVLRESALPAFATRSSVANIPVNLALANRLGLRAQACGLLIPLAAVLHMPGAAVTLASVTVFCTAALGIPMDAATLFLLVPATVAASAAASGMPNGSVLMLPALLGLAGVPPTAVALCISAYFAADIIQDAVGTALNSAADIYLAAAADRSA